MQKGEKMTNAEAVNWLINITADIGKAEHRDLWHYEQALYEIREMLEDVPDINVGDMISRQAVIDALYDWSEHSMTDTEAWHIRQVIGDIKSLPPAEPNCSEIPNNSDCVGRQAAITAIQKAYADTEGGTDKCAVWKNVGLTNALHIMQDLPSAQPERKKGRWIRNDNGTYSCSVCQSWIPEEQHYYARYCLYCGTDMRSENNE